MYGLDNERRKMTEIKTVAGEVTSTRTKYYSPNYEKEEIIINGTTTYREVNYIFAPDGLAAIYEKVSDKLYFVSSDALGSINMIVDETTGNIESDMSYDAWGRRRNAQDWNYNNISISSITDRGYTMHEMLDKFDLINMNGRAYDPLVGQFLSADPFVQDPANPQSYNRYAYCLNNPLKYTDPSGYMTWDYWRDPNRKCNEAWDRNIMHNTETGFNSSYSREWEQSVNALRVKQNWEYMQDLWAQTGPGLFGKGGYFSKVGDGVTGSRKYKKTKLRPKKSSNPKNQNNNIEINYRDYYVGDNGKHYRQDLYRNYHNEYDKYLAKWRVDPNTKMNWKARTYLVEKEHINIPLHPKNYVVFQDYIEVKTINLNNYWDKQGVVNYTTSGINSYNQYISINVGDIGLIFLPGMFTNSSGIVNNAQEANILLFGNIFQNSSGSSPFMNLLVTHN